MNFVQYEIRDRVAVITLDRPEKRNALNATMVEELKSAFEWASKEPAAKLIILRANGSVFSAGADLAYLLEIQQNSFEENLADSNRMKDLLWQIRRCPKTVIAAVQGHAIAGGCGLITACDLVYSAPEARYGYTECKIGFVPALVAGFLCQRTGESKARELLLTGALISAEEAQACGLVNYLARPGQLEDAVWDLARRLVTETSADSVAYTKQLLASLSGLSLQEGLDLAAGVNAQARQGDDFKKGIRAFLAKEKPQW